MCGHGLIGVVGDARRNGPRSARRGRARHARRAGRGQLPAPTAPSRSPTSRLTPRAGRRSRRAGLRPLPRRRRLGRQLVLPHRTARRELDDAERRRAVAGDRGDHGRRSTRAGPSAAPTAAASTTSNCSRPPRRADADSRNFVMCPGGAYDRSPCGTGTSAKMAALYARGKLALGQRWRQESITGSLFTGWLERAGRRARSAHRGPRVRHRPGALRVRTWRSVPRRASRYDVGRDVIVVGAGIVGAACAEALRRTACEVLILEAASRAWARPRPAWGTWW